tara:strand:- start:19460 stop:19843 length:384 start_codon:yes stop_codon:yes gene_type:complete
MSLSKKNKLVIILLVFSIVGFAIYTYAMQAPINIENKKTYFTGTSDELLLKMNDSTEKWEDKIVVISGKVTNLDDKGIILSSTIYCQMMDPSILYKLNTNNYISLKGRVIGYDDLLDELKLDQCIIQ